MRREAAIFGLLATAIGRAGAHPQPSGMADRGHKSAARLANPHAARRRPAPASSTGLRGHGHNDEDEGYKYYAEGNNH